jgi:hypothetical protein
MDGDLTMRNPFFNPPARAAIPLGRFNAIMQDVRNFLNANPLVDEITDAQIIALAPEFATTPGLLNAVKQVAGVLL